MAATFDHHLGRWFRGSLDHAPGAGEFDDSALMKTFGAAGLGLFPAPMLVADALAERYGVALAAPCDGVEERYWAIGTEKRVQHPLVQRLLSAG